MKKIVFLFIVLFSCSCLAQKYIRPVFDRTDEYQFHLDSVEVTKDSTLLFFTYEAEESSWANISDMTYIKDKASGKEYKAISVMGIPFQPAKRHFSYPSRILVKVSFSTIANAQKIDFIEDLEDRTAFNIYGIDLTHSHESSYEEAEINHFSNMASFYESTQDTLNMFRYKEKEIEATEYLYGTKSNQLSLLLIRICSLYEEYQYYQKAIDSQQKILNIIADLWGTNNELYATHICNLAMYYHDAKNYEMSIKSYLSSITLFDSLHISNENYAQTLHFIAIDYHTIGDYDLSLTYIKKCINVWRSLAESDKYINELDYLSMMNGSITNQEVLSKRLYDFDKELYLLPEFVDKYSMYLVPVLKNTAMSFSFINNNLKAIELCNKAIEILEHNKKQNSVEYADILERKCNYELLANRSENALELGRVARDLFEKLNIESEQYVRLLQCMALANSSMYNFEESIRLLMIACEVLNNKAFKLPLAETYVVLAHIYLLSEDLNNAEFFMKEANSQLDMNSNPSDIIQGIEKDNSFWMVDYSYSLDALNKRIYKYKMTFKSQLASIQQKKGNIKDAIRLTEESSNIAKNMGDIRSYAVQLSHLALLFNDDKNYSEAIRCANECLGIIEREKDINIHFGAIYLYLAKVYANMDDSNHAIEYANKSIDYFKNVNEIKWIITGQTILAEIYYEMEDYENSENILANALESSRDIIIKEIAWMTPEQKQRMWSKFEYRYLLYRNIIVKMSQTEEQISRLFDYVLFSKSLLLDTEYNNEIDIQSRLKITWKDIQKELSINDLAIEFITTTDDDGDNDIYHALIITKQCKSPQFVTLFRECDIGKFFDNNHLDLSDIVGGLIWTKIQEKYKEIDNIYFSPDGIFHIIPIEYLNAGKLGPIFESYNIYRVSSTKELAQNKMCKSEGQAILYGGLEYDTFDKSFMASKDFLTSNISHIKRSISNRGGFEPLYNTLSEVLEIKEELEQRQIPTTLFSSEKGTEDSFKCLSNQDIRIIHMATHGMYVPLEEAENKKYNYRLNFIDLIENENDPVLEDKMLSRSFLVMSAGNRLLSRANISKGGDDGILTAKEISNINLDGVDIVVLSACETAYGDLTTRGVFGLQRGFKKAGANTILMSLDKVDDEATKILMVEFYKNLMSGKSKLQSLKDAQKYLREVENGKYNDPNYWASFILLDGLN